MFVVPPFLPSSLCAFELFRGFFSPSFFALAFAFFHEVGLDYVSCSPFRVPGARLAAAQAVLDE